MLPNSRLVFRVNGIFRGFPLDTTGLPSNQWNYICADLWQRIMDIRIDGPIYQVSRILFDNVDYLWWVDEFVITTSMPLG